MPLTIDFFHACFSYGESIAKQTCGENQQC